MVVPGFMESRSPKSAGRQTKADWRSPFEYWVEKMGRDNLRITQLRLVTALAWLAVMYLPMYSERSLPQLRLVLMFHHTLAAAGLDEGILMSWSAMQPFALRVLTPGSVVAPFFPRLLPRRQSFAGAGLYLTFLVVAVFQMVTRRVSDTDVILFTVLHLGACCFDRGVFHSTRPSDILKFLVATLFPRPELNVYVLLACLYFWSGLVKLRGFFHGFTFPYQFLNFSGVSWLFRRAFLNEEYLPRGVCQAFGAFGTCLEAAVGVGMLCNSGDIAFYSMLAGCSMHAFIFVFGMGPFRWNLMTLYMLVCCIGFRQEQPLSALSVISVDHSSLLYVLLFGFVIPLIGIIEPITLGRYFGGYRMATFHFAGNETYRAILLRKDIIPAADAGSKPTPYGQLLREKAEGYGRLTDDFELWTGCLYSDGADLESSLRRGFSAPSGMSSFEEFDTSYVLVPVTWLNIRGHLLNTKWDESLPVTERLLDLVCETVGHRGPSGEFQVPSGAVLQLVAHVVPWAHGKTKRIELFDVTTSKRSQARWAEEVDLPWLTQNLAKMALLDPSARQPLKA